MAQRSEFFVSKPLMAVMSVMFLCLLLSMLVLMIPGGNVTRGILVFSIYAIYAAMCIGITVWCIAKLFWRKPGLTVGIDGVHDRLFMSHLIPWNAIKEIDTATAYSNSRNAQTVLTIEVHNPQQFYTYRRRFLHHILKPVLWIFRTFFKLQPRKQFPDFMIWPTFYATDAATIMQALADTNHPVAVTAYAKFLNKQKLQAMRAAKPLSIWDKIKRLLQYAVSALFISAFTSLAGYATYTYFNGCNDLPVCIAKPGEWRPVLTLSMLALVFLLGFALSLLRKIWNP